MPVEPNMEVRWDSLLVGDLVIDRDGELAFTIHGGPFTVPHVGDEAVGYRVMPGAKIVTSADRSRVMRIRRPSA